MRVLMVSDVYFPRINGVSTSILTFKKEFEKNGHQVYLLAPDYPASYPTDTTIIRIPSRAIPFDPEDRMMKYRKLLDKIPNLKALNFDLVHIHTPFIAHYGGVRIAKTLNVPCIITYHTVFEEYLFHYIPFLPKQMLRFFARRFSCKQCNQVDAVIAPSTVIVSLLEKYGVKNKIQTIPTGINSQSFANGNGDLFRQNFNIPKDKKLLLIVSRVAFEKNIGVLLEVLNEVRKQIPEVHMVIAGEGPAKRAYMHQASKLGLNQHITFVGYLDRDNQLIDCYHSADLFAFSSKTETQGLVLLEAMAAGKPVVSIAAMGTKDVLMACDGAKITDGSIDNFTAHVVSVLEDQNLRIDMGLKAKLYAQQWDSAELAKKMLKFYACVVQAKSA